MAIKTYTVRKEMFVDYAHHIAKHPGACMNIHGHTWCWQVSLSATELDELGMVMDFSVIKKHLLTTVHELFDHSLVLGAAEYNDIHSNFAAIGKLFRAGSPARKKMLPGFLFMGVSNYPRGSLKVVTTEFVPTCETLAGWFFDYAENELERLDLHRRVKVASVCIYECLHPTTSCCTVSKL